MKIFDSDGNTDLSRTALIHDRVEAIPSLAGRYWDMMYGIKHVAFSQADSLLQRAAQEELPPLKSGHN